AYAWRRGRPSAYRTLVSELMLQQTQAARVEPMFPSFVRRFPTVASLARAGADERRGAPVPPRRRPVHGGGGRVDRRRRTGCRARCERAPDRGTRRVRRRSRAPIVGGRR